MTVPSASTSAAAISAFDRPWAARSRISRSRPVRAAYSGPGVRVGRAAEPFPECPGGAGGHDLVAGRDGAHRREQELRLGALEDEPARARLDRRGRRLVVVEGGEDEHLRCAIAVRRHQLAGGGDPVHGAHPHVHQHHVRTARLDQRRHLAAVGGLADDVEVGLGVDEHGDAGAEHGLVVDQRDADRHRVRLPGTWAASTHRSPCRSAVSVPPASAIRSAMPTSPCPGSSPFDAAAALVTRSR